MAVAIRKTKDIARAIREIFEELDFVPKKKVFIKPNLCGREPIRPGENTSIAVMDALVDFLLKKNCQITIGHDALLHDSRNKISFGEFMDKSGFDKYAKRDGVRIINLEDLPRTEVKSGEIIFHLPLDFLQNEAGTYINLAKIKTHMETTVSFSLKNQMGLPLPADRIMMHKSNLEKSIAVLATICKPDLNILEAFPAMENNGPHHGKPKDLGIIAAGNDMVELDSIIGHLLGYDISKIRHLNYAAESGVGHLMNKEKLGKHEKYRVNNFKQAKKTYRFGLRLFAQPTYSCSRCITAVNQTGREFKKHPLKYWRVIFMSLFSKKRINVIFGRADGLQIGKNERFICVGNCAKKFADSHGVDCLDKCPPGVNETKEFVIKKIIF